MRLAVAMGARRESGTASGAFVNAGCGCGSAASGGKRAGDGNGDGNHRSRRLRSIDEMAFNGSGFAGGLPLSDVDVGIGTGRAAGRYAHKNLGWRWQHKEASWEADSALK